MANQVVCDLDELKDFSDKLKKLSNEDQSDFLEECTKELAARLLAKVIPRTPVGQYDSKFGKLGGTLRRGWTARTEGEAATRSNSSNAKQYAYSLPVKHMGGDYQIEIINPVHYASYVEYGHRQEVGRFVPQINKRLVNGWVKGRFMLTISEKELQSQAPKILEDKIRKFLGEAFNA